MNNIKKTKWAVIILAIIYIAIVVIIPFLPIGRRLAERMGYINSFQLFMQASLPILGYPALICLILAYYENIIAGIIILVYELLLLVTEINRLSFNDIFILFGLIPTIIGIIYVYSYIKSKKKIRHV